MSRRSPSRLVLEALDRNLFTPTFIITWNTTKVIGGKREPYMPLMPKRKRRWKRRRRTGVEWQLWRKGLSRWFRQKGNPTQSRDTERRSRLMISSTGVIGTYLRRCRGKSISSRSRASRDPRVRVLRRGQPGVRSWGGNDSGEMILVGMEEECWRVEGEGVEEK